MWTRFLVFAGLLLAGTSLCISACSWTPVARKIRPELVVAGAARVELLLDSAGRYVLITRFEGDQTEFAIVDWNNKKSCTLPPEVTRFERPLLGPASTRNRSPFFYLPVAVRDGDKELLRFADERCRLHGDYGLVSRSTSRFPLDDDGREVFVYGNGAGTVALADPWEDEGTVLAEKVRSFALVSRQVITTGPQALWFIEDQKLTQRALDGTLVLTLGESVSSFTQGLFDTLRVAYVDGFDLYEATAPDYEPVLVAANACSPVYRGTDLELFEPCEDQQLVRVALYTGAIERFAEGVYFSSKDTGFLLEYAHDDEGKVELYVEPPGRERVQIDPPFLGRPLVLDSTRLAGLMSCPSLPPLEAPTDEQLESCGENDRSFVIWSVDGSLTRLYDQVGELVPFVDIRQSSYVWLMHHDVSNGLGKLSTFGERSATLTEIGIATPLRDPLQNGRSVHGYSIELLPMYPEPLLVHISDAQPLERDARLSRGTLHARLLSGKLASMVDGDVTSYAMVSTPLPGMLYGVEEGERPGLWFAAL